MSLRGIFTILAVILLVRQSVSTPGGKHGTKTNGKTAGKVGRLPVKVGGQGGTRSPAVNQKKDNRSSPRLDILPYHYTVSIVPDLDNSTFYGEVSIDFEAGRTTREIVLYATDLHIDSDKMFLTEKRCIPPKVVEVTTSSAPSPPMTENVAPSTASPAPAPENIDLQSQTSQPVDAINLGQSLGETDEGVKPSPASIMQETLITPEEAPEMPEKAPSVPDESPSLPNEASSTEEAAALGVDVPVETEQSPEPAQAEAPVESEKISLMSMDMSQQGSVTPEEAHEDPATNGEAPITANYVAFIPDEAPVPPESSAVPQEVFISSSMSEAALVLPGKAEAVTTLPESLVVIDPEPTTVKELPAETTTVKDTFNLAGEALKILEVLNRSDIPAFIKANLTDDDDMVNLTGNDDVAGQDIDHYTDALETRTDDLAIEDCKKVEVVLPPPTNFQPPPPEVEEDVEQTTAGMFNMLRTTLDQLVHTTIALPKGDQSDSIIEIIPTSASTTNDKAETLPIIDTKSTVEMNSVIKTLESDITLTRQTSNEFVTTAKTSDEITTFTEETPSFEITTVGKTNVEVLTDRKPTAEFIDEMVEDEVMLKKAGITMTTEGRMHNVGNTPSEAMDVESTGTTNGKLELRAEPNIVSTTYKTVTVESLLDKEQTEDPLSNAETTIFESTSIQLRDFMGLTTASPINLGTEPSMDLSESITTDNVLSTTEKSKEVTIEYVTTNAEAKKSRKRRASPKRKRRPTNRNKLKQSLKLPPCTSEDLYEVRVDKALSPSKRVELESADIGVEIDKEKIRQEENDTLVLPTKIPLQAGKRYRLTISFRGKMAHRPVGLYRSDYVVEEGGRRKTKYVATTVLEPIHARRVFPCLDDPRFRSRFSMRIAHPPNLSAYSNMPASTTSDDVDSASSSGIPDGWLWDRFETTPPMPTYLVAFFVGALARKSRSAAGAPGQNNLTVRVLARRERLRDASFALNLAPKVMMEMGQWLNKPTSLTKLDLLALPGPGPDAVENWGLVSFQERYLLTQPGLLSRFSVASVLSHELAHDWFGNLVTPHHWRYAWLSEGLATYSSARILNKIEPTWDVEDLATTSAYIAALGYSDDNDAIPMQPKKISSNNYRAVFSPTTYYKGYMAMRMLKGIIGDEMLTGSLQRYVQKNEFGWAKSSRLWAAVNETAKEQNVTLDIPRSLPKLMARWLEQPGYPLVTITRNYTSGEVYVQQEKHRPAESQTESNATWWIPLRTWTANSTGAMLQWLPPNSRPNALRFLGPVRIGANQWLMGNAEFGAPLRVQYDLKNWDLLAAALPNGELPRGAGAQLSVDALSLASNGQLPFSVALKVVSAALGSRTGDAHLTWTAAGPALRRIDRELRATKASRPYRQWLHRLITPLDTWISFDARNDTVPDAVLARHVTTAACSLAMPLCLSTGRSQFRSWMASNTLEPRVPFELRGTLYCAAVRDGSSDTVWRYLWSKISTVATDERTRILKGLGCTRDPELAKRLLQLAADVKSPVRTTQLPTIVRSIAMHDSGPGVVLSFLAENLQRFANDTKTLGRLIGEVAPAINSKKDIKKLQGLLPQIKTSRATMAKLSADATASMERSKRFSQEIFTYFSKLKIQT